MSRRLRVPRITVDFSARRASRELRWLVLGNFLSGLGTQAALVALPYQVYIQTRSALLTGLLGAVELMPLIAMALLGGALADRMDRRRLLMLDQIGLVAVPAPLFAAALAGSPPLVCSTCSAGLLAGFGALQNVSRSAIVPSSSRSVINQTVTPDALRGRMSSVFSLVVTSGPRLGDVEAGAVASLTSPRFSVLSGGLACVVSALLIAAAFPALARDDKEEALARAAA